MGPNGKTREYTSEELECLQEAADIVLIPLWQLLEFSQEGSSSSADRSASNHPAPRFTATQLITLQKASGILDVQFWRFLRRFSHTTPDPDPEPPSERHVVAAELGGESGPEQEADPLEALFSDGLLPQANGPTSGPGTLDRM
jgi:hypothetical protein